MEINNNIEKNLNKFDNVLYQDIKTNYMKKMFYIKRVKRKRSFYGNIRWKIL